MRGTVVIYPVLSVALSVIAAGFGLPWWGIALTFFLIGPAVGTLIIALRLARSPRGRRNGPG